MTIQCVPFFEVFADESGSNIKTPQGEYKESGQFPVVDQGKSLVAGFVDDESRLCGSGRPAIVFGDHTRCVKYVGFPFCMGADGVKILRPKIEADLKYLYYYLRQLNLPNAGYHRHFKYLKRAKVILLPLPEQRRIAAILDQADALRAKRREALAQLDSLTRSIFIEMFGDPNTNPKGWHSTALETIATKITDGEHQTPKRTESGIKLLSARNVRDGYLDFGDVDFIDVEEHQKISKRCNPEFGDILISCSGSIGRVAIVETKEPLGLVRSAALVKPNHQMVSSKYLETYLRTPYMNQMMIKRAHSSSQANLFQGPIRTLPVMLPPFSLQQEFLSKSASVQWLKAAQHSSSAELDNLFASLQHRAFRGEL